jgi:hypothetical protein
MISFQSIGPFPPLVTLQTKTTYLNKHLTGMTSFQSIGPFPPLVTLQTKTKSAVSQHFAYFKPGAFDSELSTHPA